MAQSASEQALVVQLTELLGVSDGVEDALSHILTMEGEKDLIDYLTQLLGRNKNIPPFVENVQRFRKGHVIVALPKIVPLASPPKPAPPTDEVASKFSAPAPKQSQQSSVVVANRSLPGIQDVLEPPTPAVKGKPEKLIEPAKANRTSRGITSSGIQEVARQSKRLSKGVPAKVCGCFGSVHKATTNCLHCGRISCVVEGYDYCPFCGNLVEPKVEPSDSYSPAYKAWQQKERLLAADRDAAQKAAVIVEDRQANTGSGPTPNAAWMSASEESTARQREEEERRKLEHRAKITMNVSI